MWAQLFGAVDLVTRSVDIFSHFGVDQYLTAYGLVVVPEYRGMNIGKEILRARYLPGTVAGKRGLENILPPS